MMLQPVLLSQLVDCNQSALFVTIESNRQYRIFNDCKRSDQSIVVQLKEFAYCEWVHLHHSSEDSYISYTFECAAQSSLTHFMIIADAKKTAVTLNVSMNGKNSSASLYGFYGLKAQELIEISTHQNHLIGQSTTYLLYKGILSDASQAIFNGMITIDQQASNSCAAQYNKNLLLSPAAKAISVPSLQVLTNDVSCKHGSALGKWDENQAWYLLSRGLNEQQVHHLLVKAFLADIFHGMTDQVLKEEMIAFLIDSIKSK